MASFVTWPETGRKIEDFNERHHKIRSLLIGVSIGPGAYAFTVIPYLPNSHAVVEKHQVNVTHAIELVDGRKSHLHFV